MDTLPKTASGPSYEQLAARMRERPTFAVAEDIIKRDYPLKLPDRRFIQLYNTPEISQFRGYHEELESSEELREQHEQERLDIRRAAREAGTHVPDMDAVHEMMTSQRQQQEALQEHLAGLNALTRQQMEGMRAEQRAELERLANAQNEAANRAAMAEAALSGLRDLTLEHRSMLGQMAQQQGVRVPEVVHNVTNVHNNQMVDMNVHNQVLNLLRTNADQFGQFAAQNNLNAERMQQLLYMHLSQQPVIHIMPPAGPPEMPVVQYTGGGPPPPPPGAGAVKKVIKPPKKPREPRPINITTGPPPPAPPPPPPAPEPIPVPAIPAAVPNYDIGTPEPRPRGRPRTRSPAVRQRAPRSRPPPAPKVPWSGGAEDPPALPPPEPAETPVAARRQRSVSVASAAETVLYDPDTGEPASRRPRGRPKAKAKTAPAPLLPTQENAETHEKQQKSIALQARVLANAAKYSRPKAKAKPKPAKRASASVPEAAPPAKRPRVTKVAIDAPTSTALVAEKRPRGRPKGAVGKKKREAMMLEEELRRLAAAEV